MQEYTEDNNLFEEEDFSALSDEEILNRAEKLIEEKRFDEAQKALDCVKQKSARKHYLQSLVHSGKGWFNEARKQLKAAVKAEPENEDYKRALDELEKFRKSEEYKSVKKQMGAKEGFAETCLLCSCECCLEGLCESICDGCG